MNRPTGTGDVLWSRSTSLVLLLALGAICIRLAWIGDDAYITLRCVENLVTGNGLRWNAADRVQPFAHPLWVLTLAAGRLLTGRTYLTAIWIGIGLTLAAAIVLLRQCRTAASAALIGLLLISAHAFPEYATSGLETPLTYLLLVAFASAVGSGAPSPRRYSVAVLLAALLACSRIDLVLLCAPGVVATMRGVAARDIVSRGVVGALPFLGWLAFATIYYGTPLPVTAHAKVFGLGIARWDMAQQGLYYVLRAVTDDPVLAATIVAGTVVGLCDRRCRLLALGPPLHVVYVILIGGDFMAGRFLLPPFVVATAILAGVHGSLRGRRATWLAALAPMLLFSNGVPAWLRSPATDQFQEAPMAASHGIVDERLVYYQQRGLLSPARVADELQFGSFDRAAFLWPDGRTTRWTFIAEAVGAIGYQAGTLGHVVDLLLCDPLLARLPAQDPQHWRIGHFVRRIPEGYLESIATGENRVLHPGLHRYYEALHTIVSDPVFAAERWRTLWQMWRGDYDADLLAFIAEHYYTPPRVTVAASALATALPLGRRWFDEPRQRLVYDGGLAVEFGARVAARSLRLQAAGAGPIRLRFRLDGVEQGECSVQPPGYLIQRLGLQEIQVTVPEAVSAFDTIWVDASPRIPAPAALGGLFLGG